MVDGKDLEEENNVQEQQDGEESSDETGILDPESSEDGQEIHGAGDADEAERQADGDGGSDDSQELSQDEAVVGSREAEIENDAPSIYRNVDVHEAVDKYVELCCKYAGLNKYPPPPHDPAVADQFTVREQKVSLWMLPQRKLCEIQFTFVTDDDILVKIREIMEFASHDRLIEIDKEIRDYVNERRRARQQKGHEYIIH